jgi:hypothetical protein
MLALNRYDLAAQPVVARGNPVLSRNCPAAVSRNESRTKALARERAGKPWPVGDQRDQLKRLRVRRPAGSPGETLVKMHLRG